MMPLPLGLNVAEPNQNVTQHSFETLLVLGFVPADC